MEISVKKEDLQKKSIFVATPMYGGMNHGLYAKSCLDLQALCIQYGVNIKFSFLFNESLITRARNYLVDEYLHRSDCTHLLFIDSDIQFNPNDIVRMIEADKDIICGIYPKKEINWQTVRNAINNGVPDDQLKNHTGVFVANLVNYQENQRVAVNEPVEIWNGGTGMMLIKREVFEKLADKVPEYNNDMYVAVDTERKPKVIKEFFATSIDKTSGNRLLSEDYHFCKIAREIGIKIWAAPWVNLKHNGTYNFEGILPSA